MGSIGVIVIKLVPPSREMTVVGRPVVVPVEVRAEADTLCVVEDPEAMVPDELPEPSLTMVLDALTNTPPVGEVINGSEVPKVVVPDPTPVPTVVVELTCGPAEPDDVSVVLAEIPIVEADTEVEVPLVERDMNDEDTPTGSSKVIVASVVADAV